MTRSSWVEIDAGAFRGNVRRLKALARPAKALVVVKGNAYGHGLVPMARLALRAGADMLGTFALDEALALRRAGIRAPVLALAPLEAADAREAARARVDACVANLGTLKALVRMRLPRPLSVHLNVETGLGRDGIPEGEMKGVLALLGKEAPFVVRGLMTHFSGAESRAFDAYTKRQLRALAAWNGALREQGIEPLVHASGTAGAFLGAGFRAGLCRFGLGAYGLWPSSETARLGRGIALKPALAWRTRIADVKRLPKGHSVSYDRAHRLRRDSVVAVLPVGYYDGYPRSLSGKGEVLVRGRRAPVLGRVMMNTCVIDVTGIPRARLGDTVTLIGASGKQRVSAEDMAARAGSINYEVVTRINPLVPRLIR